MYALILKDILALKRTLRIYALFLIIYSIVGVFTDNSAFVLAFIVLLAVILPMHALTVDKACHWERYAACLPVPRSAIIASKYLFAIAGMLLAIIPVVIYALVYHFTDALSQTVSLSQVLLLISTGLILLALQMPFLFLFGPERGRFISLVCFCLITLGIPLLTLRSNLVAVDQTFVENLINRMSDYTSPYLWLLFLGSIALTVLSVSVTILLMRRRDID